MYLDVVVSTQYSRYNDIVLSLRCDDRRFLFDGRRHSSGAPARDCTKRDGIGTGKPGHEWFRFRPPCHRLMTCLCMISSGYATSMGLIPSILVETMSTTPIPPSSKQSVAPGLLCSSHLHVCGERSYGLPTLSHACQISVKNVGVGGINDGC